MESLLEKIKACDVCKEHLPLGPRPVLVANPLAKIVIIGQAPGTKVHASGVPWDDPSGIRLRQWLDISTDSFYDESIIAIVPMGFCYPGKGKSGDLPPRPECAPLWHKELLDKMPNLELVILIGTYAQKYYIRDKRKENLTSTVRVFEEYLPLYLPLPHPSPRNRYWLTKNSWFEEQVIPVLQKRVHSIIND